MANQYEALIRKAYAASNQRDIDIALSTMHPSVQWSKAWEGGYITGHDAIRDYWSRQWTEINPNVQPVGFAMRHSGLLEVTVGQLVKDLDDKILFDGTVKHIYQFDDGLIRKMDIELVDPV